MAAEIEFRDERIRQLLKDLSNGSKEVKEHRDRYAAVIAATIIKDVAEHFEQERGPESKWEAWSDIYDRHMKRIGKGGNKLLQDTGRLRQSFLPKNYRRASGGLLWFNNAKTNGNFPYAAAHDDGGPKLPARPFMWLSQDAMDSLADKTLRYILKEGL